MKKVLSMILVAAMLLASLLAIIPASAEEPEPKKTAMIPTDEIAAGSKPVSNVAELKAAGSNSIVHFTQDIVLVASDFADDGNLFGWGGGPKLIDGRGFTLKVCADATPTKNVISIFSGRNDTGGTYTIKNLNITGNFYSKTNADHTGIFVRHGSQHGATLENVVVDANYVVDASNGNVGFLMGKTDGAPITMKNVHTYGSFTINHDLGNKCVGGFIANCNGKGRVIIENCSSNADITVNGTINGTPTGGIIGSAHGSGKFEITSTTTSGDITLKKCVGGHMGVSGFIGTHDANGGGGYIKIFDSVNAKNITIIKEGTADENVLRSGFVGRAYGSAYIYIDGCVNKGTISGGRGTGWGAAGGIIGALASINEAGTTTGDINYNHDDYNNDEGADANITVKNTVNLGDVSGAKSNGGILGNGMQISSTAFTIKIDNCANYGDIGGGAGQSGGIIGYLAESSFSAELIVKNCYNAGSANAGIVWSINGRFGTAKNADYAKAENFKAPVIENFVNEGATNYAFVGSKQGALLTDKVTLTDCVSTQGGVNADQFTVVAPDDADALTATVKANIHKETNLLGFVYELVPQVDAKCTETGLEAYYDCECGCEKIYNAEKVETTMDALVISTIHDAIAADPENWNAEVAADCEETGTKAHYYCSTCGKNYDAQWGEIEDLTIDTVHSTLELNRYVAPKCEEEGTKAHYECDNCDKYYDEEWSELETIVIPSIHDSLKLQDRLDPDCETAGFEAHYHCTEEGCGKYWTVLEDGSKGVEIAGQDLVIAAGHSGLPVIPEVDSTCTEIGLMAHCYCDKCGQYLDAQYVDTTYDALVIAKKNHVAGGVVAATAASCCKNGLKEHYRCVDCGAYLPDATGTVETTEAALTTTAGHTLTYVAEKACTHNKTTLKNGTKAHYVCEDCGNLFTVGGIRVSEEALTIYAIHIYFIDNCDEENSWKECSCGAKDEDSITPLQISGDLSADAVAPVETPVIDVDDDVVEDVVEEAADAGATVTAPTASLSAAPASADDAAGADGAKADDTTTDDAKGCGSAIGATIVVMAATLALGATTLLKKKED